ncbi:MAG: sulfotransferase family protein, partial [Pseudomonadota bacterium]
MEFPGVWVNESRTLIYRVVPKAACSTIGQIMFHADHGRFFEGDIHDAKDGLWKWNGNTDTQHARDVIVDTVRAGQAFAFTAVRNPYTRLLSAFFDKICGIQRNGNKYRGDMVPMIEARYGMDIGGGTERAFDQVAAFRKFLLFVRDTIKFHQPMHADIHWSDQAGHASTLVRNGGRFQHVFAIEAFLEGMAPVVAARPLADAPDLASLPRFNESEGHGPKRAHPVAEFYDDLAISIMTDIYARDFEIFGYDRAPGEAGP